ncbi:MAG: hypothetical protein HN548_08575 [Opitutae bacterium]|jgi:hypothetical protein|nr:hypothetical protein [Opitutae bacterium]MBT5716063.1 hypothetical protein [Opitutae bacterium]
MNSYSKMLKEVESLTSQILDDNYSSENLSRLSQLLKTSKEARQRYTELTIQDSLLHWESVDCVKTVEFDSSRSNIFNFPIISSVAAAIVALFGVWWFHSKDKNLAVIVQESHDTNNPVTSSNSALSNTSFKTKPNMVSAELNDSPLKLPFNSSLANSSRSKNDAYYGLQLLKEGKSFGEGGVVEFNGKFASWKRSEHLSVPTENGVLPKTGDNMLKFSSMKVDVHSQTAESSEMLQVVDVRNLNLGVENINAQIQTSLYFNKGEAMVGDSTEFALSIHAISSDENNENASIGHKEFNIESDVNPSTWEQIQQDFTLPTGTEFVIVSMSARKEGSNALLPDVGGHYADGLSLNLFIDGENIVGPL